ncbi:MAG: 2-oxoacid:acceptor oxidoreductase subunit alpha [Acidobacteriota bacterium]|nr:2-oxoacid:acceptor oxidoreductase subunit alpha [Acidobacteriota bacterium]MDE2711172.1 2-oxoacid:acceptor oxidoreductase subunit alpha [Acidobacteriota bacterium]MXW71632.1 2-oxoacid:acceptor oxidoreductase subunit alpha [Acidobacteriota bacterium]MXX85923.1 2-oxoacid:acceptor oxidoreductase subunit alpha [Acidobacteriota bacterium]MYE42736.1 2-oxoacid:acceptor oxidoreductase subunit alpha [Acidobacteriota bacterium]
MSDKTALAEEVAPSGIEPEPIVNDLAIQVATVNGSGSQSSNLVLLRALFRMGIPVGGKNLFPSNIAGLPTWFTIRANRDGWVARKRNVDYLVALNPQTAIRDVESLSPGSAVVYEEGLRLERRRDDVVFYPAPFQELAAEVTREVRLRKLLANMIYVGLLGELLSIDVEEIFGAIDSQFRSKKAAVELNRRAVEIGIRHARENLVKQDPFTLERMDKNRGKVLIDGNAAAALGAMFGGASVATWYPITPSSSVVEQLTGFLKRYRKGPDGKATYAVVQAEDELAAVGMALAAGWAGARAMTATSGPGISLMSEFVGLGYYAEIPLVIWNIQRVGPSTGLPTRTAQGDILSTYTLSHGDTKHVCLLPASTRECFEFGWKAFDLAERLQTPVFVLSDLDLGMNIWATEPFEYPDRPMDRGKVLTREDLERLGGTFQRYADVDGDAIPYRTLPGTEHPGAAYFTRGSGHDEGAEYTESEEAYVRIMARLDRKFETAREMVPPPVVDQTEPATPLGIIGFGSSDPAIEEARTRLREEAAIEMDYLRLRALPLGPSVLDFITARQRVVVLDQNRDGQVLQLLRAEYGDRIPSGVLRSLRHYSGHPMDAQTIVDYVTEMEIGAV